MASKSQRFQKSLHIIQTVLDKTLAIDAIGDDHDTVWESIPRETSRSAVNWVLSRYPTAEPGVGDPQSETTDTLRCHVKLKRFEAAS